MKTKAFFYIVIAGVLWGTSGLFVNVMSPLGFSVSQIMSIRGTVSLIGMLAYVLIFDRAKLRVSLSQLLLYVGCGACLFLTGWCYFTSMTMTSVSTAVVLMYTAPIYVSVYSACFLGEKFTALKTVSIATMLVGCVLVSGIIGGLALDAAGLFFGFGSGLAYAGYNIFTKIAMRRGGHPISLTVYDFFVMSLISCIVAPPWETVAVAAKDPALTVPLCIGIGVVTYIIPYFLYTLSLRTLPAGTASSLSIVEPMAATLFSMIFLQESIHPVSWVGIALILAATLLLSREKA